MRAKIEPGYDINRQPLAEIVPLDTPFTLFIAATHTCNFKCFYCTHSKSVSEKKQSGFQQVLMEPRLFKQACEQAAQFEKPFKRVVFTGLGEPLANPDIPVMVQMLSDANVAQGYEIITNGYLLTHEMTDQLLNAGLTYLRVSIQGLNAQKYKEIANVDIDYSRLLDNIRYFYDHKKNCKLYVKIMDACLDTDDQRQEFFDLFGDISDKVYVEHLVKAQPSMTDHYSPEVNSTYTFYGDIAQEREVCPYLFYTLQLDAVGNVFPCPPLGHPLSFSLGNISGTTLKDIWNSKKLLKLQMAHLRGNRTSTAVCANCENYLCFTPQEDSLDADKEKIIKKLEDR